MMKIFAVFLLLLVSFSFVSAYSNSSFGNVNIQGAVNGKIFYVLPSNSTDLALKINSAQGRRVEVPYGVYNLSGELDLNSNVELIGNGYPEIQVTDSGFNQNFITFTNSSNIKIQGFKFVDTTGNAKSMLYSAGGAQNVWILDNYFYNFSRGSAVLIRGFNNSGGYGFSEYVHVGHNHFQSDAVLNSGYTPRAIYFDGGTARSEAYGNYVYFPDGDTNRGIEFDGDYDPVNWGEENKMYDNTVNRTHIGLMMENNRRSSIINNKVYDSFRGIYLFSSVQDAEIKNNYIFNTTSGPAIHYEQSGTYSLGNPRNILIAGNYLQTTANNAILFELPDDDNVSRTLITIRDNTINNPGRTPILMSANDTGWAYNNLIIAGLNSGSYGGLNLISADYRGYHYQTSTNISSSFPILTFTNNNTVVSANDTLSNIAFTTSDTSANGAGLKALISVLASEHTAFTGNHGSTSMVFYLSRYEPGATDALREVYRIGSPILFNITQLVLGPQTMLTFNSNKTAMPCSANYTGGVYYDADLNKYGLCNTTAWLYPNTSPAITNTNFAYLNNTQTFTGLNTFNQNISLNGNWLNNVTQFRVNNMSNNGLDVCGLGSATGTCVINNARVTNDTVILCMMQNNSNTGALRISARTAGFNYTVQSFVTTGGKVGCMLIEPAQ